MNTTRLAAVKNETIIENFIASQPRRLELIGVTWAIFFKGSNTFLLQNFFLTVVKMQRFILLYSLLYHYYYIRLYHYIRFIFFVLFSYQNCFLPCKWLGNIYTLYQVTFKSVNLSNSFLKIAALP